MEYSLLFLLRHSLVPAYESGSGKQCGPRTDRPLSFPLPPTRTPPPDCLLNPLSLFFCLSRAGSGRPAGNQLQNQGGGGSSRVDVQQGGNPSEAAGRADNTPGKVDEGSTGAEDEGSGEGKVGSSSSSGGGGGGSGGSSSEGEVGGSSSSSSGGGSGGSSSSEGEVGGSSSPTGGSARVVRPWERLGDLLSRAVGAAAEAGSSLVSRGAERFDSAQVGELPLLNCCAAARSSAASDAQRKKRGRCSSRGRQQPGEPRSGAL